MCIALSLNCNCLESFNNKPVFATCVKLTFSFAPNLSSAPSDFNDKLLPITALRVTDKPPSVWIEPSIVDSAFVVSSIIILPVYVP